MIIASICIHFRILLMKEKRRSSKTLYIYVVFYIPSIVFNFLLFQSFVKDYIIIYIIIILITKTIDFFGLLLYILFFTFKSFKFMIVPVITSILAIIFFHFWLNINLNNSFIVLILALIECIYIEVISRQCKLYFKKDDYLFAALIMDYLIFTPYALFFYRCFNDNINVSFMRGWFKKNDINNLIY